MVNWVGWIQVGDQALNPRLGKGAVLFLHARWMWATHAQSFLRSPGTSGV